ncbi:MAG: RluA family pseudouridine synthase [Lentisphaeria bacterium]|nr:RluA family pseudouridine synthase [Lentisphaeria bacterium]
MDGTIPDPQVLGVRTASPAPPSRLDLCALELFEEFPSKKSAYKAAKAGRILLDGEATSPNAPVAPGQTLTLLAPHDPPPVYDFPLTVLFEDESLAVIEKPPGIPVSGNYPRTVERALPANLQPSTAVDALPAPRPVHRLDAPTGGVLLTAKTASALANLSLQFEQREITKRYRAIVTGHLGGDGTIQTAVDGRSALTEYRAVLHARSLTTGWTTTVDLEPHTGRMHQLRIHMASIGHPILGDQQHSEGKVLRGKGLFLWAVQIEFRHPDTAEQLCISVPEPPKFQAFRTREVRRWKKLSGPD